jgi:hypothetical protein
MTVMQLLIAQQSARSAAASEVISIDVLQCTDWAASLNVSRIVTARLMSAEKHGRGFRRTYAAAKVCCVSCMHGYSG